jgi:hypothetical protein
MDFLNTAALPAAALEGVAGVAAAAAAEGPMGGGPAGTDAVSPHEAARFDAELEESLRFYGARASALLAR